jgi:uncharacterized protein involved in exopolysaccharide biosynthesis
MASYWKRSLIAFLAFIVMAAIATGTMPKIYVASATVMIFQDSKEPLTGAGKLPMTFISAQVALINSAGSLLPVIDKLDLTHDPWFMPDFSESPAAVRDVAVARLQGALTVTPGRDNILAISVSYLSAQRAADIANAVAQEYIRQDLSRVTLLAEERMARDSKDLEDVQRKVDEAWERVMELGQQPAMIAFGHHNSDADALADLEVKLLTAQKVRRQLETTQQAPGSSSEVLLESGISDLRGKLAFEQDQIGQLLSKGSNHASVLELQARLNATREWMAAEEQVFSGNQRRSLTRARELEWKYQAALEARCAKLAGRRSPPEQVWSRMLQLKSAQQAYAKVLDGYEAKHYWAPAEDDHASLVARATPPLKAAKPNRPELIMMAFLGALGIALYQSVVTVNRGWIKDRRALDRSD